MVLSRLLLLVLSCVSFPEACRCFVVFLVFSKCQRVFASSMWSYVMLMNETRTLGFSFNFGRLHWKAPGFLPLCFCGLFLAALVGVLLVAAKSVVLCGFLWSGMASQFALSHRCKVLSYAKKGVSFSVVVVRFARSLVFHREEIGFPVNSFLVGLCSALSWL